MSGPSVSSRVLVYAVVLSMLFAYSDVGGVWAAAQPSGIYNTVTGSTSSPESSQPPYQSSATTAPPRQNEPTEQRYPAQDTSRPPKNSPGIEPPATPTATTAAYENTSIDESEVAKCTKIIQSGQLHDKALADVYEKRAELYLKLRKFKLAIFDANDAGVLRAPAHSQQELAAVARDFFISAEGDLALKVFSNATSWFVDAANMTNPPNPKYYRFAAYAQVLGAWNDKYAYNDYAAAMYYYRQAVQLDPSYAQLSGSPVTAARDEYNRGVDLFNANQFAAAIKAFDEAIRLDPQYLDAYLMRGAAHYHTKQFVEAVDDYNNAIFLQPLSDEAYINLSLVYEAAGDLRTAENILKLFANAGNLFTNLGVPMYAISTWAHRKVAYRFAAAGAYRMCAFYFRNRSSNAQYLGEAASQCSFASRLDPGNQQYTPLVAAVQATNARVRAQEQAQRDAEIRAAFRIGLALVLAGLLSESANSTTSSSSLSSPKRNDDDWPILGLAEDESRPQSCEFVSQSGMNLNDGRSFTGGPGTQFVCH